MHRYIGRMQVSMRAIVALLLTAACSSCSQYIFVPAAKYPALDPEPRRGYRIVTIDQQQFIVTRLAAADSALIIQELKSGSNGSIKPVPFTIPYVQIDKIEKIDRNFIVPIVLGAAVVFVVVQWEQFRIGPNN